MKISEAARSAGVTAKAIRYYESLGLITPGRLANGYRTYGSEEVRLLQEIRTLRGLGIPLERARPFLDCLAVGHEHGDDCPASLAGYRDVIDELTERIQALSARRELLRAHLHQAAHRNSARPDPRGDIPMNDLTQLPAGLPVPEDDGAADHLPGRRMPGIEMPDTSGGTVRLDALGVGRTVLYLFPLMGTPDADLPEGWNAIPGARGCTPETCDFRDHHQDLVAAGAVGVHGLSMQDTDYLGEIAERLRLPFSLLSDPALRLADALDLPLLEAGGMRLFKRLTLVVRDGTIEHAFYPVFPPDEHARQVLNWLRDNPA